MQMESIIALEKALTLSRILKRLLAKKTKRSDIGRLREEMLGRVSHALSVLRSLTIRSSSSAHLTTKVAVPTCVPLETGSQIV